MKRNLLRTAFVICVATTRQALAQNPGGARDHLDGSGGEMSGILRNSDIAAPEGGLGGNGNHNPFPGRENPKDNKREVNQDDIGNPQNPLTSGIGRGQFCVNDSPNGIARRIV